MRRSEWILGGILGVTVVGVLVVLLVFWIRSQPEEFDINNLENLTARQAYDLAEPVAREWSGDAVLLNARAGWQPEVAFTDGRASWSFVFYSSDQLATAMISVADGKARLLRSGSPVGRLEPGDLAGWQLDSPEAIDQLLRLGADDFMAVHQHVNLILTLDAQGTPTWRSTFLDTETKQAYNLNILADSGEFTP